MQHFFLEEATKVHIYECSIVFVKKIKKKPAGFRQVFNLFIRKNII